MATKTTKRIGYVMVHAETGLIWAETFANNVKKCRAIAAKSFALDGEILEAHPEWQPKQCIAKFNVKS